MQERVVEEVVGVEDLSPDQSGCRRLRVRLSDGSELSLPPFYADEWLISEGDLVGRTREEIRSLMHRRDLEFLRDVERPGQMPFFEP